MAKIKNAGELRTRLDVFYSQEKKDQMGNIISKPMRYKCSLWGRIEYKTAKAVNNTNEIINEILVIITVRFTEQILKSDIITVGNRLFVQIGPPIDVEDRHAFIELTCKEVVG